MVETEKRYLITKGELPRSAGGGKTSIKEKIVFCTIIIVLIIFIIMTLAI